MTTQTTPQKSSITQRLRLQPLDSNSNALPTELPREICGMIFKQLLYRAIV